ncbi:hypothetical protein ACFXTH_002982 [Malus domestica]
MCSPCLYGSLNPGRLKPVWVARQASPPGWSLGCAPRAGLAPAHRGPPTGWALLAVGLLLMAYWLGCLAGSSLCWHFGLLLWACCLLVLGLLPMACSY